MDYPFEDREIWELKMITLPKRVEPIRQPSANRPEGTNLYTGGAV